MTNIKEITNPTGVMRNLLASSIGLDKYSTIINTYKNVDVSNDIKFQRNFNGFYVIRRNIDWLNNYYTLFERVKGQETTFEEILRELYDLTNGRIEASFSSKMYATLYPEKPIWDQFVLKFLRLKMPDGNSEIRLKAAIVLYSDIEEWYKEFLCKENAKLCLALFDEIFPDYKWVSDIMKIDFNINGFI